LITIQQTGSPGPPDKNNTQFGFRVSGLQTSYGSYEPSSLEPKQGVHSSNLQIIITSSVIIIITQNSVKDVCEQFF
jgi:hypothetical protein